MPTTPKGFPYPTPDDPVSLGANDIKALAEAADARSLWRMEAGYVRTDDYTKINSGLSLSRDEAAATAGIRFGSLEDTGLFRAAGGFLKTGAHFQIHNNLYVNLSDATNGGIIFGAAGDTALYRSAAAMLKTPGGFQTDGLVYVHQGRVTLGAVPPDYSAGILLLDDTALYRSAAKVLKTDGNLRIQGTGLTAEQSGLELYIDGAWRRVSRRSDGVMIC